MHLLLHLLLRLLLRLLQRVAHLRCTLFQRSSEGAVAAGQRQGVIIWCKRQEGGSMGGG